MEEQLLKSDFGLASVNYLAARASKGQFHKSNLNNSQAQRVLRDMHVLGVLEDGERYSGQETACFSNLAYYQGSVDQAQPLGFL
ncbi:hypothetical protein BTUL_0103g00360 [Botrytis tulipae]|uniref:Uncharacterized protein n=1 Tax=Botrytis tulipae TaxID=87230 RepID=A0A4Z1EKM4_9HELO|nr:hypothetical protein BTUL_0103g00360 [Botrytis tulipae]